MDISNNINFPYSFSQDQQIANKEIAKQQGLKKAKLTLIHEIGTMLKDGNREMTGEQFDKLFDMDLDLLYQWQIKLQDSIYNFT